LKYSAWVPNVSRSPFPLNDRMQSTNGNFSLRHGPRRRLASTSPTFSLAKAHQPCCVPKSRTFARVRTSNIPIRSIVSSSSRQSLSGTSMKLGAIISRVVLVSRTVRTTILKAGLILSTKPVHLILTQVRPDIHCPHVGPKGGSPPDNYKCVDIDYSDDYFDDAELFGEPLGNVFTCDGPLLS
jgi:hypothetical protein